ncbi:MAG: hypothetical protein ABUS79_03660 [Pseudomonadota bacterium]
MVHPVSAPLNFRKLRGWAGGATVERMKSLRRLAVAPAFALFLLSAALAAPGCATVATYLPTVIAAVTDGALVLDTIDKFVDRYFESRPNPDLQKKADIAIARTRSALDAALRIAAGTKDLNEAQVDAAFAEFRIAYTDLMALLGPLGVSSGNALRATPGGLTVPEPLALARR